MYAPSVDLAIDSSSRVSGTSDQATVVFEADTDCTVTIKDSSGSTLYEEPASAGTPVSATFTVEEGAAIGGLTIVATASIPYPADTEVRVYNSALGTDSETFSVLATTYSIAFDGNDADNPDAMLLDTMSLTYDQSATLVSNAYTREGYTFEGWNTLVDGTGTSLVDEASAVNLIGTEEGVVILYAQWTEVITPGTTEETATTADAVSLPTGTTSTTLAQTADSLFPWMFLILGAVVTAGISLQVLRKKVQ
jgi:uncharacterized repeat protein (TIGR02543 family)